MGDNHLPEVSLPNGCVQATLPLILATLPHSQLQYEDIQYPHCCDFWSTSHREKSGQDHGSCQIVDGNGAPIQVLGLKKRTNLQIPRLNYRSHSKPEEHLKPKKGLTIATLEHFLHFETRTFSIFGVTMPTQAFPFLS